MFEELLAKLAKVLGNADIPYMIIGGQAVLLYGEPRLTRDIDITLGLDSTRMDKVTALLPALSLKALPGDVSTFVRETMVLPALEEATGIRVDFIFSLSVYESEAIERARKVEIRGEAVAFASPEDLIIHKIFSGRPRDLEDVRILLIKNRDISAGYIRRWLGEFDKEMEETDFLNTFENLLKDS